MPDIDVTCEACGKAFRVSEFVSADVLRCPACGTPCRIRASQTDDELPTPKHRRLRLKSQAPPQPPPIPADAPPTDSEPPQQTRFEQEVGALRYEPPKKKLTHHIASWLIFIVLGTLMGLIRYRDLLPYDISMLQVASPYIVILFNVIVVLKAFKDDVMQGILCLLVPFYWVYYLFLVTDDFYLRAVVAAMLIGTAQDSYYFFTDLWSNVYHNVSQWIGEGGGEVKRFKH